MSVLTQKLGQLQSAKKKETVHLSVKFTGPMADIWHDLSKDLLSDLNSSDILKEAVRVRTFIALAEREGAEVTVKLPDVEKPQSLPALLRLHRPGNSEKNLFPKLAKAAKSEAA